MNVLRYLRNQISLDVNVDIIIIDVKAHRLSHHHVRSYNALHWGHSRLLLADSTYQIL